jgi:hypothetical protein
MKVRAREVYSRIVKGGQNVSRDLKKFDSPFVSPRRYADVAQAVQGGRDRLPVLDRRAIELAGNLESLCRSEVFLYRIDLSDGLLRFLCRSRQQE